MSTENHAAPGADESSRDRLDRCHGELVQARRALETAEQATRRLSDAYAELDERHAGLTKLYVAMDALYDAADECAALRALSEVMVNLAGSEEFGVYAVDAGGGLPMLDSFGLEAGRMGALAPTPAVADAIRTGSAWHAAAPHPAHPGGEPIACIPLRIGDRVAFAVVVWSYLPQKRAFDGFDVELYALLANRAAPAIRTARLLERAT
jgi:GAF domain-containing protein